MRSVLFVLLFIMAIIISSCEKPEAVLPKTPATQVTDSAASVTVTKASETQAPAVKAPTIVTNSEFYQSAKISEMPYRILLPRHYDSTKTYPVLVFLHGVSERGTDNEKQLLWGSSLFQEDSIREKYPAYIVFPQCPATHFWSDLWASEKLKSLVDTLKTNYSIDNNRVYIGGLSMGAFGTYAMVERNPELFAAAVAISGDGDANKASLMAKPKWRVFAGKKDTVVTSNRSEKMVKALKDSGASVSFTLYPNADHLGSWL